MFLVPHVPKPAFLSVDPRVEMHHAQVFRRIENASYPCSVSVIRFGQSATRYVNWPTRAFRKLFSKKCSFETRESCPACSGVVVSSSKGELVCEECGTAVLETLPDYRPPRESEVRPRHNSGPPSIYQASEELVTRGHSAGGVRSGFVILLVILGWAQCYDGALESPWKIF